MKRCLASLLTMCLVSAGCAVTVAAEPDAAGRLNTLLPADAILLGEQHDAPEHQRIHREVIDALAARGALAALALEMAPQGGSTAGLDRTATEAEVQAALRWGTSSWSWGSYGPAIMAAVRAGVPVLGANLPRADMRAAMAESQLDALLPAPVFTAHQQAIRVGHCDMLPETQIVPMTRIQIARDRAMAQTLTSLVAPGKTVVLVAGGQHVDRRLGVPLHLPPTVKTKVVTLRATSSEDTRKAVDADTTWSTPPVPKKDYCAGVRPAAAPHQRPADAGLERPVQPN